MDSEILVFVCYSWPFIDPSEYHFTTYTTNRSNCIYEWSLQSEKQCINQNLHFHFLVKLHFRAQQASTYTNKMTDQLRAAVKSGNLASIRRLVEGDTYLGDNIGMMVLVLHYAAYR